MQSKAKRCAVKQSNTMQNKAKQRKATRSNAKRRKAKQIKAQANLRGTMRGEQKEHCSNKISHAKLYYTVLHHLKRSQLYVRSSLSRISFHYYGARGNVASLFPRNSGVAGWVEQAALSSDKAEQMSRTSRASALPVEAACAVHGNE